MEIETLKRLRLKDNDIIVLKHPYSLSQKAQDNILGSMRKIISKIPQKNIRVVVLEEGMDVEVIGE